MAKFISTAELLRRKNNKNEDNTTDDNGFRSTAELVGINDDFRETVAKRKTQLSQSRQSTPEQNYLAQDNSFFGKVNRAVYNSLAKRYTDQTEAFQKLNLPDNPSYTQIKDTISSQEQQKSAAARRGKDTSAYDKAIEMLRGYADKNYGFDTNTSASDREALYADKKRELKQLQNEEKVTDKTRPVDYYSKDDIVSILKSRGASYDHTAEENADFFIKYRQHIIPHGNDDKDENARRYQGLLELIESDNTALQDKKADKLENEIRNYERQYPKDFYQSGVDDPDFDRIQREETVKREYVNLRDMDKLTMYRLHNQGKLGEGTASVSAEDEALIQSTLNEMDALHLEHMTSSDEELYYYLLATQGEEAAYDYLEKLKPVMQKADTEAAQWHAQNASDKMNEIFGGLPVSGVATLPLKAIGGVIGTADNALRLAQGKDIEPYSQAHLLSNVAETVAQHDAEYIDKATKGFHIGNITAGDLYQFALSGVESIEGAVLLGPAAYSAVMSMDAAQSKAKELYDKGATASQIFWESTAAGAIEYITEKVSLDLIVDKVIAKQLTKKTLPRFIVAALESAGVEASEEFFGEIANYASDIVIMGVNSERQQLIDQYISQGHSEEEAEKLATRDFKRDLNKAFVGGAIGGLVGGGGMYAAAGAQAASVNAQERAAIRNTGAAIYDAQNIQSLIDAGKSSSDEAVRKQAEKTEKLYNQSDKKSSRKLNKAAGTLYQQLQERDVADVSAASENIRSIVRNKVVAATGSENAVIESAIIKSEITRDPLTAEEQKALQTTSVQTALNELRESGDLTSAKVQSEKAWTALGNTLSLTENAKEYDTFDTSDDGNTYIKGSDNPVNIRSIAEVGADDVSFKMDDNTNASGKDIVFPDPDFAAVMSQLPDIQKSVGVKMSANVANAIRAVAEIGIKNGTYKDNAASLVNDVREVYTNAYFQNGTGELSVLTPEHAQIIANAAQAEAKALSEKPTIKRQASLGKVTAESGINLKALKAKKDMRGTGVAIAEHFAEATGVNIHFFESKQNSEGKWVSKYSDTVDGKQANSPNGFYKDGKIWIDINAGANGEGLILFTLSHELVHFIKDGSPQDFNALAGFLMDHYGDGVHDNVHWYIQREMRRNHSLTPNQAYEEVIARMCESFLTDIPQHIREYSAELHKESRGLWGKIRDFLKDFTDRINRYYKGKKLPSDMAYEGRRIAKKYSEVYDLFLQGVQNASENLRNAQITENTTDEGGVEKQERYSYDYFISKPDMTITLVEEHNYKDLGITRSDIVNEAIKNAGDIGYIKENGNAVVHVDDIDTDVILTPRNLKHGLDRRINVTGPVTEKIGEIIKHSIKINELIPRRDDVSQTYVLVGFAKNKQDVPFVVNMVVNRVTNELDSVDVLYATNAKKESGVLNEPAVTENPLRITDSTISIRDLLDYVNRFYPDILPEGVLKHYGYEARPKGSIGESALYQDRITDEETISKEKVEELIRKEREEAEERINKLVRKYEGIRKANLTKRNKSKARKSIKKNVSALNKMLNRSAKDKTVKEGFRETAADLLKVSRMLFPESLSVEEMATYGVADATEQEEKLLNRYKKLLESRNEKGISDEKRDNINAQLKYMRSNGLKDLISRERQRYDEANRAQNSLYMRDALTELADAYKKTQNAEEAYIRDAYEEEFVGMVDDFKEAVGDKLAKNLSLNELIEYNKIVTMMVHSIRNANKMFIAGRKATLTEAGTSVMSELKKFRTQKAQFRTARKLMDAIGMGSIKPIYLARYTGSDTLTEQVWKLQQGEMITATDIEEAKNFKEDCEKKWNYKDFDFRTETDYESINGRKFSFNLDQKMEIYAISRRPQGLQHLLAFGFTYEKGKKVNGKYQSGTFNYPLTAEIIESIADSLTANEKGYAVDMQDYLSTVMAEKGNEVSMQLYGVKLFNEDTYWSLTSNSNFVKESEKTENDPTKKFRLKNAGFTKQINRKANNPLVLRGFEDTWCNHVFDMSTYHGMVLPLEDFNRVLSYKASVDQDAISVRSTLDGTYIGATKYFDTLIDDLNGGITQKLRTELSEKLISLEKKSAVMANLSVVVQQPSALFRAMAYVNPKYFAIGGAKGFVLHNHNKDWNELKKYAPVAIIKEMGGFDTGTGRGVLDYLTSGKRDSKIKQISHKVDDILSWAPQFADELAWIQIWHSVQRETKAKYGYKVGSEQNKIESGKRFSEVIHLTQVYDSTLSRSANMRSKNTFDKILTSYMAEPLTYANMALDMVIQAKRSGSVAKGAKIIAKTGGALAMSMIANAILHAIVVAMRDDDENEKPLDKYSQALWEDLIDGVNPLNYAPVIKDVWSIVQGYKVERMDVSLFADGYRALNKFFKKVQKGEAIDGWDIMSLIGAASSFIGKPVDNVVRDIRSVVNTYHVFKGTRRNAQLKDITGLKAIKKYQQAYDNAWEKGFSEEECVNKAESAARSVFTADIKPKYLNAIAKKDFDSAADLRSFMYRTGLYKDRKGNATLKYVENLTDGWVDDAKEAAKRLGTATQRRWSK